VLPWRGHNSSLPALPRPFGRDGCPALYFSRRIPKCALPAADNPVVAAPWAPPVNRVGFHVHVYLKHGKARSALRATPTLKGDRLIEIGSLSNDGGPVLRHVIRLPRTRRYRALRREKMPQIDDPGVAQDVPLLVAKKIR
jgi:hypothetical protein